MIDPQKIKELFSYEEIDIKIKNKTFDFDQVRKKIMSFTGAWNDPVLTENYLVFKSEVSKNDFISKYIPSKKYQYPYVLVISVQESSLYFNLFAGEDYFEILFDILGWVSDNYACQITDTHGTTLFEFV